MLAPIGLFVYKRPEHTVRVLEGLRNNRESRESDLFVFSDGAKNSLANEGVSAVRVLVRGLAGFRSVTVVEQSVNLGLARSIVTGVTDLTGRYGRVIVLEDDVVPAPHFLQYMNAALEKYEHVREVISIHGYSYPVHCSLPETFFLRGADCWGWATWARGWRVFEPDGAKLLTRLSASGLASVFDLDGGYPYTKMLEDQVAGRNDSWAIRWHAAAFLEGLLTLYPGSSQVQNIGTDGSGTHGGRADGFWHASWGRPVLLEDIPIQENQQAREAFVQMLKSLRPSLARRIWARLRRMTGENAGGS
ncbi:MAG: glycosyltransferase family 2 protein [Nitrospira sp.]|nr:glycosyltransferase family 2 protein [Nitrospira sp.]